MNEENKNNRINFRQVFIVTGIALFLILISMFINGAVVSQELSM